MIDYQMSSLDFQNFLNSSSNAGIANFWRNFGASHTLPFQSNDFINELSPFSQLLIYHELIDVSSSSSTTQFAYRKQDGSLAMQVKSSTDIHLKQETIAVDLAFSAEMVGLNAEDFAATNGEPIKFQFSFQQTNLKYSYQYNSRTIKTLKKPQDVLADLAEAVLTIMRNRGDKPISLVLDSEAFQSIVEASSPEMLETILGLLIFIQMTQARKTSGNGETIVVSGKGKPYQDIEEKTSISGEQVNFNVSLTINPPAVNSSGTSHQNEALASQTQNSAAVNLSI